MLSKSKDHILLTIPSINSSIADLSLYKSGREIKTFKNVQIGKNGAAWGIDAGLNDNQPRKVEGDGKTPLGVFRIGVVFNKDIKITDTVHAVDDPKSQFYNQIVDSAKVIEDWDSSEKMWQIPEYKYGFEIWHNKDEKKAIDIKSGSCIFYHLKNPNKNGTEGCVAMEEEDLLEVINFINGQNILVFHRLK